MPKTPEEIARDDRIIRNALNRELMKRGSILGMDSGKLLDVDPSFRKGIVLDDGEVFGIVKLGGIIQRRYPEMFRPDRIVIVGAGTPQPSRPGMPTARPSAPKPKPTVDDERRERVKFPGKNYKRM